MCTFITYLFSFSRQRWHDFFGREEYLLYRNQEKNFEVGTTETFPGSCFSKAPKTFRARKAIRKTPSRVFCRAGLFICCIGNQN